MITELQSLDVIKHATLQQLFDRINLLGARLAGIDEATSETSIILDVYISLLQSLV